MEEVCKRFPGLAEDVIAKIDPKSLTRFKKSSRGVSKFLENGRGLWKQMILKSISGNFQQHLSKNDNLFLCLSSIPGLTGSHRILQDLTGFSEYHRILQDLTGS